MSGIVKEKNSHHNKRQKIVSKALAAADGLSLGISIVLAVLIGIAIGYLLKKFTSYPWLFWVGVFWGVSAAILNVYKAYKTQVKAYAEFKQRNDWVKEKIKQEKINNGQNK